MGYDPIDTDETDSNADKEITVDAINGADTSAAAAGEALTSNGSGSLEFASVGSGQILRNGSEIEYIALDESNLPAPTESGEVALLTASNEYVQDVLTGTAFDITTASFFQSINTQAGGPQGLAWNDDGTRLYEVGSDTGGDIFQLTVSTPFDITTATFDTSINSRDNFPTGITWNNDGSRLYEVDAAADEIYQYTVSTPFDITTATFDTSINAQSGRPEDIAWNDDGSRLYEVDNRFGSSSAIFQYTVSTPFDIATATSSTSISTQDNNPTGITWNNDGSRLYEIGQNSENIYQLTVSTPFDITTATFDTSINTQDSSPRDIAWNNDGSQLYEMGRNQDKIYEYSIVYPAWEAF